MRWHLPIALALLACALVACGGPPKAAQQTLTVTARVLVAAEPSIDERYDAASRSCYDANSTRAGYDACMDAWERIADAVKTSRHSVLAGQVALDTWERIDDEAGFFDAAACIAHALAELTDALTSAGVPVPDEIATAIGLAHGFGGACQRGE